MIISDIYDPEQHARHLRQVMFTQRVAGHYVSGKERHRQQESLQSFELAHGHPTQAKSDRNKPCRCGSGKKTKLCCGR